MMLADYNATSLTLPENLSMLLKTLALRNLIIVARITKTSWDYYGIYPIFIIYVLLKKPFDSAPFIHH